MEAREVGHGDDGGLAIRIYVHTQVEALDPAAALLRKTDGAVTGAPNMRELKQIRDHRRHGYSDMAASETFLAGYGTARWMLDEGVAGWERFGQVF
ncbi:hypothetical protein [Mycolicibacterium sp.]|uniref:hypothetical protein n=1 Tax=Mycolicibacterium sp. TaxID=2320850 RepID=UPI0037C7E830